MAGYYRSNRNGEGGLSEVVGFILLLALIIAAFSIWLTYGIPVQGRENEINHMNDVKDEFTTYKTGIDSLWINGQTDSVMSTAIKMGTSGQTSQGSNMFLPIVQPVGSGGTLVINNRTPKPEWLNISSYSYITNTTIKTSDSPIVITNAITSKSYQNPPDNLLINISGLKNVATLQLRPGVQTLALNSSRSINVSGIDLRGTRWQAWINVTPRATLYQYYTIVLVGAATCPVAQNQNGTAQWINNGGGANRACFVPMNAYNYTGSDLTLSVFKNNTEPLNDMILSRSVSATGTPYVFDLVDPIYDLKSNIQSTSTISYVEYDPTNDMATNATAQYDYWYPPIYNYTTPLGAVEYRANNYYYIPQTYYYQAGGVFLSQSDGVTSKLPPQITFSYNKTGSVGVNIAAISIDQTNSGSIGGTAPVKIGTKVKSDSGDLPYAAFTNNTMNVTVNYTSPTSDMNTILMWKNYFQQAANITGGIPDNGTFYTVGNTTTGAYIVVKGINDPLNAGSNPNTADISLKGQAVNLSVSIQSIGGV